jgi:hypothetical protein
MQISPVIRSVIAFFFVSIIVAAFFCLPEWSFARNLFQYKDTISTSAPEQYANHTLSFTILTPVPPEGYIEVIPPTGFTTVGTSTFAEQRNVELLVNGVPRVVGPTLSLTEDEVTILPGSPGLIRYTLNSSAGISAGSQVQLKIGNHTSNALAPGFAFSTSTGTTTTPGDIKPIQNSVDTGTHEVDMRVYDSFGAEIANGGFLIALIERVGVGPVDTKEFIPPLRFNGLPTSTVGGTTLNVEISLETDEFAYCRFSRTPNTDYDLMSAVFSNTGLIFHTTVVSVTPNSQQDFYVRCRDDENNKNIDDYPISFFVNALPTGSSTENGDGSGTGSGTGGAGSGSGSGEGNLGGSGSGGGSNTGSSGGGSGGGGGGGSGGGSGSGSGGGFESSPAPFRSGDAQVEITGFASPRAKITALVDGKVAANATADGNGAYSVLIDKIARGAYTFGVYATDVANTKSSTFSTSFTVTGARTSALSNINIAPSILVTPNPVTPPAQLTISGYTIPNATVTIENEKDRSAASRKSFTATANNSGAWSIPVPTDGFSDGTYKVRAKAVRDSTIVNFSQYTLYGVGAGARTGNNSDLNRDGKVNLTDFSILLFWWNTNGGDSNPPADISQDSRVNLTDFSILLFNWTG